MRDVRTGAPALENARFRAGSVTKVVTAAIVLQLAAEGRIDLDGTVQHYMPGLLTEDFAPITVRQLLNYTSGLRPGASLGDTVEEGYAHRFETLTPRQVVAASVAEGPEYTPGTRQTYGNIHYTVLGMLIEKVTGDSYAHQAAVRIFRPLGMRHSSFPLGADPRIHGPHNRGYDWMDGRLVDVTDWNMTDRFAAGDLISTTADLERLLVELFRGRVVPEPQLREMFTVPDVPGASYGAGLERFELGRQGDLGQDRLAAGLRHGDRRDPGPVPDPGLLGRRHGREGRRPGRRPAVRVPGVQPLTAGAPSASSRLIFFRTTYSGTTPKTPKDMSIRLHQKGIPRTGPHRRASGMMPAQAIIPNSTTQMLRTGSRYGP
ncbi:hypothetical protein GCM10017687_01910 [Streptomyces echinatus]